MRKLVKMKYSFYVDEENDNVFETKDEAREYYGYEPENLTYWRKQQVYLCDKEGMTLREKELMDKDTYNNFNFFTFGKTSDKLIMAFKDLDSTYNALEKGD